ncbi:hypothetical protein PFISCL1PPCAC_959 [Pristionchus fissidentatus]|uniref:Uncharacterized protein n=1 Tax=Pristionchus fissidentatus TaxID=1538716 RepID=A0AAV5USV8_9BILA|nr:hypothetical protein PFISCL1PPCAC_959 [Pristionchus fissidentatus]
MQVKFNDDCARGGDHSHVQSLELEGRVKEELPSINYISSKCEETSYQSEEGVRSQKIDTDVKDEPFDYQD